MGGVKNILPPVYHGNPLTKYGALVYYDYGKDIFKMLQNAGFSKIRIICSNDIKYGHYGAPFLYVAEK
ncbi:hypothetical protein AGMMS50255_3590 [Spirochaetia bacterium]|nr:hypothetical protein AGMMS50255_3590 [Spirochaetia bacterium]